jgi:hypothetical protein
MTLRKGFRSEFERGFAHWLIKNNVKYDYEKFYLEYQPKIKRYTPDFYLTKQDIYIETKGFFDSADRKKHLLVKEQNPDIDIRFLFVNANNKLNKSSKTTYGAWCDKHNKFYLIMTPSEDGQAFDVTAYDTTDPKNPIPSAFFVLKGLMDIIDTDLDGVVQKGQMAVMDKMVQLESKEGEITSEMLSDNIEKVKIGKLN